ncbi:TetR family transcriptional regulator C-terminal domain-containing protein [Leisingera sp. SS27]|uniref:TetR family transcriptional regulator C-terminal domain-containing protein n=1 Tax=Leisingera sp. SS27 TaxID=2979462 RepID=UPI0023310473|nr:TetR family transcriptional regulator C-terminal domain-containing protein [Leisingera sp. SS27]MDC0659381.1 TetR family transcriptional regulator C-terminal domain-containing protein [Leisingera sp. SS27]
MLRQPQKQIANREKNISRIKEAAEYVFAEHGYFGASFSLIAKQAKLPKSNIIYYFTNKETLYRAVVEDIFDIWRSAADSIKKDNDPSTAIAEYIDTKLEMARNRPFGSKVWANEVIQGAPIVQDYMEDELHRWTNDRMVVIQHWIDSGKLRATSARHLLYLIWAGTQHYADFQHQIETLNDNHPLTDEQWQETKYFLKDIILRGICVE